MSYPINILTYWDPNIYFDVNGLPDPFTIEIPLGITNNENSTLYFKATLVSPSSDWSDYEQELGSVGSGATSSIIYTPKRAQPTLTNGEYDETITLKIEAYTDDTYSTLYGSQTVDITIHFFDHSDSSWTVLYHDNFDDGTSQGWSYGTLEIFAPGGSYGCVSPHADDDHYISSPYALRPKTSSEDRNAIYKNYSVGEYNKAIMILHFYSTQRIAIRLQNSAGKKLVKPDYMLNDGKWHRVAFALNVNDNNQIQIQGHSYIWIDEIWVIAK